MTNTYVPETYLFTGAGNNFVVFDGRSADMAPFRQRARISELCAKHHTDGLMILTEATGYDFSMEFYNPDGSGGMMCGNGGRCIVAFADYLGLKPASPDCTWHFLAPDGPHEATILLGKPSEGTPLHSATSCEAGKVPHSNGEGLILGPGPSPDKCHPGPSAADSVGKVPPLKRDLHQKSGEPSPIEPVPSPNKQGTFPKWTVRLKMIDVQGVTPVLNGYFLNTGTRHYVEFRDNVDAIDMEQEAKPIRWDKAFQPEGANVNFVQQTPDGLKVRTFEKGVEGETLACGTGLTASAIAAYVKGIPGQVGDDGLASYRLQCRRGDWLQVEFKPDLTDVYLTGPAEML